MIVNPFYKNSLIISILAAATVHGGAIAIRKLSPIPAIAPLVDAIAFNGVWVYLASIAIGTIIDIKHIKQTIIGIPERILLRTVEGQKSILRHEFTSLFILLILLPVIIYFYSGICIYFKKNYPEVHRFLDYIPLTGPIEGFMTSFPFFIILFVLVSLLCLITPHTYLTYKYAQRSPTPLYSAMAFSIVLSIGITAIILGLLAASISTWLIFTLLIIGPVILFSYILINIIMLRYHDKFTYHD